MSSAVARRPEKGEYAEYFDRYIQWVDGANILDVLEQQRAAGRNLLAGLSEEQADFRYEPGKWSVKELIGHVIDTERVFAYRALRFARNDATALAGFDQDAFAANANYVNLPTPAIAAEFEAVRHSTLLLLSHISADAWDRRGISNKNELSVRAAAFVIAGHAQHHIQILKSRYLDRAKA